MEAASLYPSLLFPPLIRPLASILYFSYTSFYSLVELVQRKVTIDQENIDSIPFSFFYQITYDVIAKNAFSSLSKLL